MSFNKSCSILIGSLSEENPILLDILLAWVSTAIPCGLLKASSIITLALFLPTPGIDISSSIVSGTLPPKLFTIFSAASFKFFDLVL